MDGAQSVVRVEGFWAFSPAKADSATASTFSSLGENAPCWVKIGPVTTQRVSAHRGPRKAAVIRLRPINDSDRRRATTDSPRRNVLCHACFVGIGLLASLSGCAGTTPKVDNPVLGAAPPRKPGAVVAQATTEEDPAVVSVSFESQGDAGDEWNEVAGRVDGLPIFARDVLEADRPRLEQLKLQAPPEVYAAQREKLLKARMPQYIEQRLLLSAVHDELNAEQLDAVDEQLVKLFDEEIERLKKITKARTLSDLEDTLATQGTSLASLRQAFNDRQMAGQYLGLKMSKIEPPTRPEIVAEYEKRREQYLQPADVRWQQVWIPYAKHGGRDDAFEVLKQAAADIKAGVPFDVVIGRYSDGPMKEQGGLWDYTTRGNLASKDVEDALFTLPIGEISRPFDVGNAFQIVRVADRREERVTPLSEVQEKIAAELGRKRQNDAAGEVVGALWRAAAVQTRFDDDAEWQEMINKRYGMATTDDET